jgi:hypothetical protein
VIEFHPRNLEAVQRQTDAQNAVSSFPRKSEQVHCQQKAGAKWPGLPEVTAKLANTVNCIILSLRKKGLICRITRVTTNNFLYIFLPKLY